MNTGQTMITILAVMLLSATILTVNRGFLRTDSTITSSRINIMAISIANSIIEDATNLSFDEKTVTTKATATSGFTSAAALGVDATETRDKPKAFDDFDDYNCYATTPKLDTVFVEGISKFVVFKTYCKVDYIDQANPDNISTTPTWHKRLKLRVCCPDMMESDTIRLSTVYSYWVLD